MYMYMHTSEADPRDKGSRTLDVINVHEHIHVQECICCCGLKVIQSHVITLLTLLAPTSPGLGLHPDSEQIQVAIKWWLEMDTSSGFRCAMCPHNSSIPLATILQRVNLVGMLCLGTISCGIPLCRYAVLQVSVLVLKLEVG